MMNDKNKDVLKLLKSWGICDRYVYSVSITLNAGELPVVQVEYELPRIEEPKAEQEEYKPKFKAGEWISFPLFTFDVEIVSVVPSACASSDVDYRIRRKRIFSVVDEVEIISEQGLIDFCNTHGGKRQGVESPIGRCCCQ